MPEIIGLTICRRNRTFGSCLFFAVLPESYMYLTDNSQLLYFKIPYLYTRVHMRVHTSIFCTAELCRDAVSTEKTIYMYSHLIMQVTSKGTQSSCACTH
jgi:hypothetical protein